MHQACLALYSQDTLNIELADTAEAKLLKTSISGIPSFVHDSLYNAVLQNAVDLQKSADSLDKLAFQYRQQIMFMAESYEKSKLQKKVIVIEENMKDIQEKADSLFILLNSICKPVVIGPLASLLILDTVIDGIKVYHYNLEELIRAGQDMSNNLKAGKKQEGGVTEIKKFAEEFGILPQTPYSSRNPFEFDFAIPPGVFYRIQIAALGQQVDFDHFGGIYPITAGLADDGKITRYFAGKFSTHANAEAALRKVRSAGFKDAFIVSYYNGQRMTIEKVREFEKSSH